MDQLRISAISLAVRRVASVPEYACGVIGVGLSVFDPGCEAAKMTENHEK